LINLRNSDLDFQSEDPAMNKRITNELLKIKKVRLVEDKIAYEDLAVMDNFSEDEITFELNRKIIKEKKDKIALKKARKLEQQLKDLKQFSIDAMRTIVDTIKSIDENSKKIVFKHFDQENVNLLAKEAPDLLKKISKIGKDAIQIDNYQGYNSDELESDSSGNQSDNDEINMI